VDFLPKNAAGVVQADITNNQNGLVVVRGELSGLNTSAFAEGAQLYLSGSVAGGYTATKPVAPIHLVYVGVVSRSHSTQGQIEVAIQNGYELDELHDLLITSKTDKDSIFYDSVSGLWKNRRVNTADISDFGNIQRSLSKYRVAKWTATGNSTTITAIGGVALSTTGTATTINVATTNRISRIRRVEYLTTASTTAAVGIRVPAQMWSVGASTPGDGGFKFSLEWVTGTGQSITTSRCFAGMAATNAGNSDISPSSLTDIIGMGWESTDTNVQLLYRGSGTINKIDLGSSFPIVRVDRGAAYEIIIEAAAGTTQSVVVTITNIETGAVYNTTITTGLPSVNTYLAPRAWMGVGGTNSVIGMGFCDMQIESDY